MIAGKVHPAFLVRLGLTWNMMKNSFDSYMLVAVESDKYREEEAIGLASQFTDE